MNVYEGMRLNTAAEFGDLPVGTVICETRNESRRWTKGEDHRWRTVPGDVGFDVSGFSMDGYNRVFSLPDPSGFETADHYRWRFRDQSLRGAERNSISIRPVIATLERMGVGDEAFQIGAGVRVTSHTLKEALPDGTVVYIGSDPTRAYVRQNERWLCLDGHMRSVDPSASVVIEQIAGSREEPSWLAPGTDREAEEQAIAIFKRKAWRLGREAKRINGWCSAYETVMQELGIDASCDRTDLPYGVGDVVTPEQAATLPVGTVFEWRNSDDASNWAFYRRDDKSGNTAKTVRICGRRGEGNVALGHMRNRMTVVATPDSDMAINVRGNMLEHLPIGTRFVMRGNYSYVYCVLGEAGRHPVCSVVDSTRLTFDEIPTPATINSYYRYGDFTADRMSVIHFPGA